MQQMKFGDFQWPNNPKHLEISRSRRTKEWTVPFSGEIIQDLGCGLRTINGEGEFFGAQRQQFYDALELLLREGGERLLSLPETKPFFAHFLSLERTSDPGPEVLRYRFSFRESREGESDCGTQEQRIYFCGSGENLWDIAAQFDSSVELLVAANPQIPWPTVLKDGERVVIP